MRMAAANAMIGCLAKITKSRCGFLNVLETFRLGAVGDMIMLLGKQAVVTIIWNLGIFCGR